MHEAYRAWAAHLNPECKATMGETDLRGVRVGTTETFQGAEKKVVVLSTVRY